jgi:hypothetical protein
MLRFDLVSVREQLPDIPDIAIELDMRAGTLAQLAAQTVSESMRAEYLKMADMYRRLATAERDLASNRSMASAARHCNVK